MRESIQIPVFAADEFDSRWPSTDASECVAWFAKKLDEIPVEYRSKAKIEIKGYGVNYEDATAYITIFYERPETDDEMTARETEDLRKKTVVEQALALAKISPANEVVK